MCKENSLRLEKISKLAGFCSKKSKKPDFFILNLSNQSTWQPSIMPQYRHLQVYLNIYILILFKVIECKKVFILFTLY